MKTSFSILQIKEGWKASGSIKQIINNINFC